MIFADRIRLLLVTYGGSGLIRVAPGTWGSAAAMATVFGLLSVDAFHWAVLMAMVVVAGAINVSLGRFIVRHFGRQDPGAVVIDECAGVWLALIPISLLEEPAVWHFALCFVLFRALDIAKPLGIKRLESLPGGWGVLLDDLLAGAYVALLFAAGMVGMKFFG